VGNFSAAPLGEELYDHRGSAAVVFDMDDDGEARNVVANASLQAVRDELRAQLHRAYSHAQREPNSQSPAPARPAC
jgi:hypothetical protein